MNYKILENIYLLSNGIIFDQNMNIIKLHRDHDLIYSDFVIRNYNIKELVEDEYVDLTHYYSIIPFAHRYDEFSRVRHVENLISDKTKFLMGNLATEYFFVNNRFREECNIFNIKNIIYHPDDNTLFKIKKLIYPIWLYGESPAAFTQLSYDFCKNKYTYFKKEEKYKLFLTRYNMSRSITNHEEVHDFFRKKNFIIIDGKENLKDTINYFYNADTIVGIHGGLFSNLIFCNNINKIIEIFPKERFNGCFMGWNDFIKTEYIDLIFESKNNNIIFDQYEFDLILKNI